MPDRVDRDLYDVVDDRLLWDPINQWRSRKRVNALLKNFGKDKPIPDDDGFPGEETVIEEEDIDFGTFWDIWEEDVEFLNPVDWNYVDSKGGEELLAALAPGEEDVLRGGLVQEKVKVSSDAADRAVVNAGKVVVRGTQQACYSKFLHWT